MFLKQCISLLFFASAALSIVERPMEPTTERKVERMDRVQRRIERKEDSSKKAKPAPKETKECKRLFWFTSLALPHNDDPATADYKDYLEVALISALRNAPSLVPILIYDGPPSVLSAWFESMGGIVIFHHLSVYKEIREAEAEQHVPPGYADFVRGTYLRLDIPFLFPKLLERFGDGVDPDYYLYTDSDVMFFQDIDSCSLPPTKMMYMGAEFDLKVPGNAGVLYINADGMRDALPVLLQYARSRHWNLANADQTLLMEALGKQIQLLPKQYNYKGYYGPSKGLVIVHFHGPKPKRCLPCYLRYPDHYKEDCEGECGGLVNVLAAYVKDKGMFYRKLMQVWMRLHVEAKASQNRDSDSVSFDV